MMMGKYKRSERPWLIDEGDDMKRNRIVLLRHNRSKHV